MTTKGHAAIFAALLREHGVPEPVTEFMFHPRRKWRADFCWKAPEHMLILECDGGLYSSGRHSRGAGAEADHEKLNEAAALGYRVLRCVPRKLCTMATVDVVRRALRK